VADQTRTSTIEELHRAVQDKERELSDLDLILADYHAEHSRLIRELRRLRAQLRDAEEAASSVPGPVA
jgi:ribosomal protein L29